MRITPLDIRKQDFRKTMRGLDADEVYAFLSTVAEEYEAVLSDNKKLRERIVEMEERLEEYKNIETNLRNTLITAEKLTNEAKENAHREAGLILREAEMEADKAAESIRAHTRQLRHEILELKKQKDNYLNRLKTLMDSHRRMIEGFEQDFADVDREIERIGKKVEKDADSGTSAPRMSREKITEEFGGKLEDKSTWGEERRRENEERPAMPPPGSGREEQDSVEEDTPPEDSMKGGGTGKKPESGGEEVVEHLDTEPIGAVDDFNNVPEKSSSGGPAGEKERDNQEPEAGENQNERRVQDEVAGSMEDRMYPEAGTGGDGKEAGSQEGGMDPASQATGESAPSPSQGSPAWQKIVGDGMKSNQENPSETAAGGMADTGQVEADGVARPEASSKEPEKPGHTRAAQEQPPVDSAATTAGPVTENKGREQEHPSAPGDHWKEYEVREESTDWKKYDISEDQPASESGQQQKGPGGSHIPPADDSRQNVNPPADHEVEEALSGLSETDSMMQQGSDTPPASQAPGNARDGGPAERTENKHDRKQTPPQRPPVEPEQRAEDQGMESAGEHSRGLRQNDAPPQDEQKVQHQEDPSEQDPDSSKWSFDELKKNLSNLTNRE